MRRRKLLQTATGCSLICLFSGCSLINNGESENNTQTSDRTVIKSPSVTLVLEIVNRRSTTEKLKVFLSKEKGDVIETDSDNDDIIYSNVVSLEPQEMLDLTQYRNDAPLMVIVSQDDSIIFSEYVKPHVGYTINLNPESQVDIETVVS